MKMIAIILCGLLVISVGLADDYQSQSIDNLRLQNSLSMEELKAGAKGGDPMAQYALGWVLRHRQEGKDLELAIQWWSKAANAGLLIAQVNLGGLYLTGTQTGPNPKKAFKWYLAAATNGHVSSMTVVASMYGHGHGTRQSMEEAFNWTRKGALNGDAFAQSRLAEMYSRGSGTKRNRTEEVYWCRKSIVGLRKVAATQFTEAVEAQIALAKLYYHGKGVVQDYVEAAAWGLIAASNGDRYWMALMDLESETFDPLRDRAQRRAKEIISEMADSEKLPITDVR
jgi:uncharacterized protein